MTLTVHFLLTVIVRALEANYTGKISLGPDRVCTPKTFYFLVLNPYAGADAEFSVFEDEAMQIPFAEAVGKKVQGYNPHTGKPVTNFDFGIQLDDPKIGLLTIITMIISEGIYQAELRYRAGEHADKDEPVPSFEFNHIWKKDFSEEAVRLVNSFLLYFGK